MGILLHRNVFTQFNVESGYHYSIVHATFYGSAIFQVTGMVGKLGHINVNFLKNAILNIFGAVPNM